MKIRLILYVLIMSLICNYLFVGGTYAWFIASNDATDGGMNVGLVNYEKVAGAGFVSKIEPIVQGEELLITDQQSIAVPISIINYSTVPTKIKLQIKCQRKPDSQSQTVTDIEDFTDALNVTFSENTVYLSEDNPANGVYSLHSEDGFLFYKKVGSVGDDYEFAPPANVQNAEPINLISSIKLSDNVIGTLAGDDTLIITITYYARQSRYLDWQVFDTDVLTAEGI